MQAVNSGTNVLMGSKMRFQMDWLQQSPEDIPLSGKTFLLSQPEIRTNLKVAIGTYCRENSLQNFQVHISLSHYLISLFLDIEYRKVLLHLL